MSALKQCGIRMVLLTTVCLLAGCQQTTRQEPEEKYTIEAEETEEVPYDEPLPQDYEGTLSMWGWDDVYFRTITSAFQEKYPNVTFEYTNIAHKDLPQKYEMAMVTGGELPDIGWSIVDSRGEVFEMDLWEPLEQEPYLFDIDHIYEYLHPHMINSKGNVCGIEQSLSPAGLAYRKDLAKKYLGTDDPGELEEMMPDWNSFIEKGAKIYEESDGQVYMCYSLGDIRQFIQEQEDNPWSVDGKVDVEKNFGRSIRLLCRFRDEHVADDLIAWTVGWNRALSEDYHIFTVCATWSVAFSIEAHDEKGKESGHWGLMSAPEGNANWGGTAMGITRTCRDKRLAWEFLKFAALSTEGAEALNSMGLMTAAKQPYKENPELKSFQSRWFGDQDLGVYYMEKIIPDIKTRKLTPEDIEIHECLGLLATALNRDLTMDAGEALELVRKQLSRELPECEVY